MMTELAPVDPVAWCRIIGGYAWVMTEAEAARYDDAMRILALFSDAADG